MRVYAGIDGGGTNTDAALISDTGDIVAQVSGGPSNPYSVSPEQAVPELERVLDQLFGANHELLTKCDGICLGMSGIDKMQERHMISDVVVQYMKRRLPDAFNTCPVWIVTEGETALMASLGSTRGVLCISGTGSIIYGFTSEGTRYRAGGWGHLLGDEGSGYRIGQRALQSVMQSHDGILPPTRLTALLLQELGLKEPTELKDRVYRIGWGKKETASLARLAIAAAEAGDPVASDLVTDEARQLAETARALIARDPEFPAAPVVLSGSLFRHSALYREAFMQQLSRYYEGLEYVQTEHAPPPAIGAARLARFRRSLHDTR